MSAVYLVAQYARREMRKMDAVWFTCYTVLPLFHVGFCTLSLSVFQVNVGLCVIQNQDVENSDFLLLLLLLSVSWIK